MLDSMYASLALFTLGFLLLAKINLVKPSRPIKAGLNYRGEIDVFAVKVVLFFFIALVIIYG